MDAAPELEAPVSYLVEGSTDWQRAVWEVAGSVLAVVEDGALPSCRRRPRRCLVPLATLSGAAATNVRHLRPPDARSCGLRVTVAPGRVVYASVASSRVRDAFVHAFSCVAADAGSSDAATPAFPKCFRPSGGGSGSVSRATTLAVWHDSLPATAASVPRSPPRSLLSTLPAAAASASAEPALVSTRHPQRPPPSPPESSLSLSPPTSAGVRDVAGAGDAPPPPPTRYYNVVLLYSCEAAAVAAAYAVTTATLVLRDNRPRRSTFVLDYGDLVHGCGDASPRRAAAAAAAAAASSSSAAASDDVCLPTLADLSAALSISVDAMLDLAEERRRRRLPPPPAEEPAEPSADDAEGGAAASAAADVGGDGGGVSGLETDAIGEAEEEEEDEDEEDEDEGAAHEACGAEAAKEEKEEQEESAGVFSSEPAESFSSAAAAVAVQGGDAEEAAGDEALALSQEVAGVDDEESVWQGLLAPPQPPRQPPPPPPPPQPPAVQVAASPAQTTPLNGCGVDGCTQTVEEVAVQTAAAPLPPPPPQPLLAPEASSMASSLASASLGDALGAAASGLSRLSSTSAPWHEEPLPFWWTLGDGLSAGEAKGRRELTRDDEHRMLRLREQRAGGAALPPEQVRELEELEVVNQRFIDAGLREMRLRYPPPPKKPRDKKEAEEERRKEREKERAARETEREERRRAKHENALALGLPPPEDKSAVCVVAEWGGVQRKWKKYHTHTHRSARRVRRCRSCSGRRKQHPFPPSTSRSSLCGSSTRRRSMGRGERSSLLCSLSCYCVVVVTRRPFVFALLPPLL